MTTTNPKIESVASLKKNTCPLCGGDEVATTWNTVKFDHGAGASLSELSANLPVRSCGPCDFQFLDEEAERLKHEVVCRHLGVLTPDEIGQIRMSNNLSRAAFSNLSGIGEASLHRWENGLTVQTHAYDRYLRLLAMPDGMRALERVVNATDSIVESRAERRWRSLKESQTTRNEQNVFQLRKAA